MSPAPTPDLPRRSVLAGIAGLATALVGCGTDDLESASTAEPDAAAPASARPRRSRPATEGPGRQRGASAEPSATDTRTPSSEPTTTGEPDRSGGQPPSTQDDGPRQGTAEPDDPQTAEPTRSPTRTPEPPLLTTDAVPVGGGVILAARSLVVTQPDAGTFRGFDTHCTHAGCPVDRVAEGTIHCPCHSSRFSVADGSPVAGPARRPLEPRRLAVRDGGIYLA